MIDSRVFIFSFFFSLESSFKVSSLTCPCFTRTFTFANYASTRVNISKNVAILSHKREQLRETHLPLQYHTTCPSSNKDQFESTLRYCDTTLTSLPRSKFKLGTGQHLENQLQPKKGKKESDTSLSICNNVAEGVRLSPERDHRIHRYHPSASLKTPFSVLSKQKLT